MFVLVHISIAQKYHKCWNDCIDKYCCFSPRPGVDWSSWLSSDNTNHHTAAGEGVAAQETVDQERFVDCRAESMITWCVLALLARELLAEEDNHHH